MEEIFNVNPGKDVAMQREEYDVNVSARKKEARKA